MIEKSLKIYQSTKNKINALSYAMYMINWDSETEAPVGCLEERSKQLGNITKMIVSLSHKKTYVNALKDIIANKDKVDEITWLSASKEFEELEKELKVPSKELVNYQILLATSGQTWLEAKQTNNYKHFAPKLDKIITWQKKYIKYLETPNCKGYNVLLDTYEKGFTEEDYDKFFDTLRTELVPFVKEILSKKPIDDSFNKEYYPIELQKEFAKYLLKVMCFDKTKNVIKESEHPFTTGYGTTDERITCHYYDHLLTSFIFSIIHEMGHATYEKNCDPKFDDTALSGGSTMAMHESQSRFYENIVGRSYQFWKTHYPILKQTFVEQLKDISLDQFYRAINKVENSLIRTEADELTYPLHIMIRYEIEKKIFNNEVKTKDLPKLWNKLYKEYLNIDVKTDTEGILQDIHWSGGSFGYFPTYALGSAYSAQLYNQMKKELNVEEVFAEKDLTTVNEWLKEKVHKFGKSKTPQEILIMATGEPFNPKYYIEYLKEKYKKIYD